jgi:hypothetical protein
MLGVSRGFEPLHPPLSLARRLVGIFRPVVQIAMLLVFHTEWHFSFRHLIAP